MSHALGLATERIGKLAIERAEAGTRNEIVYDAVQRHLASGDAPIEDRVAAMAHEVATKAVRHMFRLSSTAVDDTLVKKYTEPGKPDDP